MQRQPLKILLSAYACEPNKGSEPGVGWNWAIQLANLGYKVWVLTKSNNKENIESELLRLVPQNNLHFIYFDLPYFYKKIKKRIGIQIYYEIWQSKCLKIVRQADAEINFDVVHHITFGVFRHPSNLYKLGKPFVFGPVGGCEYATESLLKSLPFKNRLFEKSRTLLNDYCFLRKSVSDCLQYSSIIFCKTLDTYNSLPVKYRDKALVQTEIGIENRVATNINSVGNNNEINILYAGNLLHLKGVHIAIKAFASFSVKSTNAKFYIAGKGPFSSYLKKLVKKLRLEDKIVFVGQLTKEELDKYYLKSHIFLFPSLHDSSGNVVLEAMSFNLPTICLKLGGPALLLGEDSPTLIDCTNKSEDKIVQEIASLLYRISTDKKFSDGVKKWTYDRVQELSWKNVVQLSYSQIENRLFNDRFLTAASKKLTYIKANSF